MKHKPTILYNPTNEPVEFMLAHKTFRFEPGEKKMLDGFAAYHGLKQVNTGLKEYKPNEEGEMPETGKTNIAYDQMAWKELVSLGAKRDVFRPGMKKKELIEALEGIDE